MTLNVLIKKGKFDFEKALATVNFDTEKLEKELEIYAKSQPPKIREKLRKDYNKFMNGCGWPLELVEVDECENVKVRIPKVKPKPKPTVEPPTEPETPEPNIETEQKEEKTPDPVPETPPQTEAPQKVAEPENTEIKKATKTDKEASATAYFKYPDANLFKKLYETMNVLVNEMTWNITKDGVTMRQMDPSHVAMIDLAINREEFEEYDVETPGLVTFDAETIKKIVFAKPFKKDESIAIKIDGIIGRITFTIKGQNSKERTFPTLEPDTDNINVPAPKISFNAKCKVTTKQLAEDIADLTKVSDHMKLIATPEKLQFTTKGDIADGDTTYKRGDDNLLDIDVKEDCKAVYSLTYLEKIIKPMPALGEITIIEFASDMPIKITNQSKFGEIKVYIAPRIEQD